MAYESILKRLAEKELITPYFEAGMIADKWPEFYNIAVDSREYYGKGDGYFHPSTHPLLGARELYLRFHPDTRDKMVPERKTLRRQMILATGSALHGVVQTQMQTMKLVHCECEPGAVHTCGNIEVEYVLDEHHVRGRMDFIVDHPNGQKYIVELKTMDPWIYKKFLNISAAEAFAMKPEWDSQLSLAEYSRGVDHGILLLMERGGAAAMREFFHHRNDDRLDATFEKFAYVRKCIAANEIPKYCCTYGSSEMKSCAARFSCWLREDD